MVGMYALAEKDFDMALLYMRGNRIMYAIPIPPSSALSRRRVADKKKLHAARPSTYDPLCRDLIQSRPNKNLSRSNSSWDARSKESTGREIRTGSSGH